MTNADSISGAEYLDVSNVTDMSYMFNSFGSKSTILNTVPNVSKWNTGNVTNMSNMFKEYGNKSTVLNVVPDVSGWNTGNVTSMANMFNQYGYSSAALTKVTDVSGWSTAKLKDLGNMFQNYGGLNTGDATTVESNVEFTLDLSGWDLTNLTNGESAFALKPKTFNVTIPAKTGEKANETGKWYYGNGTDYITPPFGKTFTLPAPAGALKGEFSVSATKKVHFSKGNLVATINDSGAPTAWKFAANQYDYIGEGGANKTIGIAEGDVDLFGWSTASTTYGISKSTTNSDYSGDFVDWGKAYCEKNSITPDNTWRTLSKDEWTYLFNTRTVNGGTGAGKSYSLNITYGGKMGVVLYPDDYSGSVLSGTVDSLPEGVVFLPAAGYRGESSVHHVGVYGNYWSSSDYGSNRAYRVRFSSDDVNPGNDVNRYGGYSVRLITDIK